MRRLLQVGIAVIIFGTLIDLAYHAVMEPDEIFPTDAPVELVDHLIIMGGLGLLILGAIVIALKDE